VHRSNPASSQRALTPEDIRTIRGRTDAAAKMSAAAAAGFVEALVPGALAALVPARPKRALDAKSEATQAALKAAADAKRARKAARLAKELGR